MTTKEILDIEDELLIHCVNRSKGGDNSAAQTALEHISREKSNLPMWIRRAKEEVKESPEKKIES